jgi:O-antigen ligase/polysaccharide polymerase Wzy-like membrane protein
VEHADTAQLAAVVGALGSLLALLARGRLTLVAGLVLLLLAEAGLARALSAGLGELASAKGAGVGLVGLAALAAAAWVLARRPALVPLVVLAAAPFRPPLQYDSSSPLLVSVAEDGQLGRLLPLYFVVLAAVLALGWRALRGDDPRPLPRALALPAAGFFAFAFLSLLWADDVEAGVNLLAFFTVPFAALLAVVARAPFPEWVSRNLARIGIGLAALFAAVGLVQAATHTLFFYAPNLEVSNANSEYFRVTSLFGDPSLYARHVVLGLGVVLVLLALRRIGPRLGLGLVALMWAGLLFSYSQSSMVALVVVTLAVAFATGDGRMRRAVVAVLTLAAIAGAGFVAVRVAAEGASLNRVTSDRTKRVEDTARVVAKHPVVGVGIGGQPRASRILADSDRPTANFVSHTTPLTVAAELGAAGLALYLWLLAGGASVLEAVHRREQALGLALGVSLLGLFVHSLFYSGFLEDPITWVVLAVGAGWLTWDEARETARERYRRRTAERARPAAAVP